MKIQSIPLAAMPGTRHEIVVRRFGQSGARPKAYVQGGLHADEAPGMLTAHHLCGLLAQAEAAGTLRGEVVVVPLANPIGANQRVLGSSIGRFDLRDGGNFNRLYPALAATVAGAVAGQLGPDPAANAALIRTALLDAVLAAPATTPAEHLKRALLRLAIDADIVLDLHCDGLAAMHLYGLTPQAEQLAPLAALLGAQAVLLATESGDNPFDEACSRPWLDLQAAFPDRPIPLGCLATTVELRGAGDVSHALATSDARALLAFLAHAGCLTLAEEAPLPTASCMPTPLAGVAVLEAPHGGVFVAHLAPGTAVRAGDTIADVVDPVSARVSPVIATGDGVLFGLSSARFVAAGQRLGKIAGLQPMRVGKLLSP